MRYFLVLLNIVLLSQFSIQAQGIEFFHGSWADALEKAKSSEKLIFIDAYAQWCGPCKKMAATAFRDEKVGKFFNENFINLKIDWESEEAADLKGKFSVNAYPTLFFVNAKGELIKKEVGGRDADGLLTLAKSISSKVDNSKEFEVEYKKGNRDSTLIYNYVKALNKAGKPSLKIVNEYISKQKDFTSVGNLKIIFEGATEADSKVFDLMLSNKAKIIELFGEKAYFEKVEKACQKTVNKAIQFQNKDLIEEANNKMESAKHANANAFATTSIMDYCKSIGDADGFCAACKDYIKDVKTEDPAKLHTIAKEIAQNFPKDKNAMKLAEKYAEKATKNSEVYEYFYTYSSILLQNGNTKDALKVANKTKENMQRKGLPTHQIDILITKIKETNS
ncbi:MAG: thioredoxin family protein [Saprospiraceae bacterium]|nr:thioredoxin family protein [Saprospiraceae bacterium]